MRGAAGASVAAGASGVAGAQDGNETGGNETGDNETGAGAEGNATGASAQGGGGSETVSLVDYAFEPGTEEPLGIAPGTTVTFVWETGNHNIVVESQPEGAGWEGHEPIEDQGFEYEHTFDAEGTYEFYCQPHENLGMTGTIEVSAEAAEASEAGEAAASILPDSARTIGIATTGALASVLALAYFFMKYGGDYGEHVEE